MENKQIFSIRKTALGVGSVLLGTLLFSANTLAHADEVEKQFNDISATVEVVAENQDSNNIDISSLPEGKSIYIVEDDHLNEDNNSKTEYKRFIKVTPTADDLARGFDYIKEKYKEGVGNATILTEAEIEKQGGLKNEDLIITGNNAELSTGKETRASEKIDKYLEKVKLPYIYYPEKSITWNPKGNDVLTYDMFSDKLTIEPTNSSITSNEVVVVKDELSNTNVSADKFTFTTEIDGESFTHTGNSTITNRNFSINKIYNHEHGKLAVNYMFYYNPATKEVEYIGKNSKLIPKKKQSNEVPTHVYNVGLAMKTTDGRITTHLTRVLVNGDKMDYSDNGEYVEVMSYDREYGEGDSIATSHDVIMNPFRGWGDLILAREGKYSSSVNDDSLINDNNDSDHINSMNKHFESEREYQHTPIVVWKDGKEPTPLKPGEKLVKEYKLYYHDYDGSDNRWREATDWKTVTFVGDTKQYDKADDFRELDAKEIDKIGDGKTFKAEFPEEFKSNEFDATDHVNIFIDGVERSKPPKNNNYEIDGSYREFYEDRKRVGFVTSGDNLGNHDGVSWDLVPAYYEYGGDTAGGYHYAKPWFSHSYFYRVYDKPSTINLYRVHENGSVVVAYENELGEVIKNEETLIDNQPVGTQYSSEPTDTIVGTDGKTYYKVKLKDDSQPSTGDVTKETKKVTWIYRLPEVTEVKGNVVVKYVDTEGRELLTEYPTDEKVVTTVVNRFTADGEKQLVSSTPSNETYNVEGQKHPSITDQNIVYNFKEVKDSKPLTGTLVEGETVITLVYEQANVTKKVYGRIVYDIVNEYGDILAKDVTLDDVLVETVIESPTGEVISRTKHNPQYDYTLENVENHTHFREFPPIKKPAKFDESIDYTKDRQYGNWAGPTPIEQPELFTMKEPYTGEIHEGDNHLTFVVTYPGYDGSLRRNVKVNFVNEKGETIKDSVITDYKEVAYIRGTIGEGTSISLIRPYNKNEQYDVSSNAVDFEIDSKRYTYLNEKDNIALSGALGVAWDVYNADKEYVDVNTVYKNFTFSRSDAPEEHLPAHVNNIENHDFGQANMFTGYHAEDTLELTLVFREEKLPTETREEMGHIKVVYTDETGREIDKSVVKPDEVVNRIVEQPMYDGSKTVVSTTPTNVTYDVTADKKERIEFDGKVYKFKQVKDIQSTGPLAVGETVVTYVYDIVKGDVEVKYVDSEGRDIKDSIITHNQVPIKSNYDVENKKENEIEQNSIVYRYVRTNGNISGKVTEDKTVVEFVYEIVKGDVNVKYVDEEGTEIKPSVKALVNAPIKSSYNVESFKENEIQTDKGIYRYVRTDGEETGLVTETPKTITYVYKPVEETDNKIIPPRVIYEADPNSPSGTREEVPGEPPTTDITGKILEEGTPTIIKVGTKTVVEKEPIPFETEKRNNDKIPVGKETVIQKGKVGERVITKTYTVNPENGEITENVNVEEAPPVNEIIEVGTGANKTIPPKVVYEANPNSPHGTREEVPGKPTITDVTGKILEEGNPTIVKIGTKTVVKKEPIPFETEKRNNDKVPVGKETVVQKGKDGTKTTTTTYTVNPETGEITENVEVSTVPPVTEIIEVGTSANKTIPPKVIYEANPNSPYDTREEIPGKPTITDVTGKILEEGTPTVIKVGTKTTVTKEEIPHSKTYVENPNEESGKTSIKQKGKIGTKTTTTTYTVDPKTGKVTSTDKVDIIEPVEEIIQVGTKTKVSTTPIPFKTKKSNDPNLEVGILRTKQQGKDGTKTIITTYRVDPKTGKVTEQVDTKVIPSVDEVVEVGTKEISKKEEPKKVEVKNEEPKKSEAKKEEPNKELPKTGSVESGLYSLSGYSSLTGAFGYLYSTKKKKRNK